MIASISIGAAFVVYNGFKYMLKNKYEDKNSQRQREASVSYKNARRYARKELERLSKVEPIDGHLLRK